MEKRTLLPRAPTLCFRWALPSLHILPPTHVKSHISFTVKYYWSTMSYSVYYCITNIYCTDCSTAQYPLPHHKNPSSIILRMKASGQHFPLFLPGATFHVPFLKVPRIPKHIQLDLTSSALYQEFYPIDLHLPAIYLWNLRPRSHLSG